MLALAPHTLNVSSPLEIGVTAVVVIVAIGGQLVSDSFRRMRAIGKSRAPEYVRQCEFTFCPAPLRDIP